MPSCHAKYASSVVGSISLLQTCLLVDVLALHYNAHMKLGKIPVLDHSLLTPL